MRYPRSKMARFLGIVTMCRRSLNEGSVCFAETQIGPWMNYCEFYF